MAATVKIPDGGRYGSKQINRLQREYIFIKYTGGQPEGVSDMTLLDAKEGQEYIIKDIAADDEEMVSFLFTLGCYSGEPITVVSHLKGGCVVSIKDGRYNIDTDLAQAISI